MPSHNGSTGSLTTMLVPILIIGGLAVWLWMLPGVRIAVRQAHGRFHRYFFGPADPSTAAPDQPATQPADPAPGGSDPAFGAPVVYDGLDAEKDRFDYSIFDT